MSFGQTACSTLRWLTIVCTDNPNGNHWRLIIVTNLILRFPHESLDPMETSMTQALVPCQQSVLLIGQVVVVLVEESDGIVNLLMFHEFHHLVSRKSHMGCSVAQVHQGKISTKITWKCQFFASWKGQGDLLVILED